MQITITLWKNSPDRIIRIIPYEYKIKDGKITWDYRRRK